MSRHAPEAGVRTLAVRVHHWPIVAAGVPPGVPAATVHANRVVVANPAAEREGVVEGIRRREAQGRCPALLVLEPDPSRDARVFEPVVAALTALTPRIEISFPGIAAFATRGPSRYFGGDAALAERARSLVAGVLDRMGADPAGVSVGVADGPFAAHLAAAPAPSPRPGGATVVPPGESAAFLAPVTIHALGRPELTDVLGRLGITTLGALAALPAADVAGRFGADGIGAHRLARGLDERPVSARIPPPDLEVAAELDPPAERVDTVAFIAKTLADDLQQRLAALAIACTRLLVVAETEHGERHERLWRDEGALTAGAVADRVRWQLDGWINGSAAVHRPTAGISLLKLVPDEVVPARGRQLGFWGGTAEAGERAARALARVEALLGPGAAAVPERRGGRAPAEQVAMVPASAVDLTTTRPSAGAGWVGEPWPGRMPAPSPAIVHAEPVPADLVDAAGGSVGVSGRGVATAAPARVTVDGRPWGDVVAWAGPWPADERWWDRANHRRRARVQIVASGGRAGLFVLEAGRWWLEATYD
jgi:protein ImuB